MSSEREQLELPEGVTEADLIDLADGRLAREREGAVLDALKADPGLGLMVKQMRADAAGLAMLAEVRAPGGLGEGIEARLQTIALRDLAKDSESAAAGAVPVSSVQANGTGPIRTLLESVWTRRLAAAAALAIAAGLGMLGVRQIARSFEKSNPVVADNSKKNGLTPEEATPPTSPEAPAAVEVASGAGKSDADSGAAPAAVAVNTAKVEMTEARAAMLAREGRLVVTVRTEGAAVVSKRLDALARAAGREGGWQVLTMETLPVQYAGLLTPSWSATPLVTPRPNGDSPVVASDQRGVVPQAHAGDGPPGLTRNRAAVKSIYTVEIAPSEKGVAGLMRVVTDGLPEGAIVTLRELAQGVPEPVSLDPESVLWWNGGTGKWVKRAKVPVVVEGIE